MNWWVPLPQAECMEAVTHPTAPGVRDLEEERLRGDARRADWGSPLSQSALTHVEDLSLPLIQGVCILQAPPVILIYTCWPVSCRMVRWVWDGARASAA